MVMGVEFQIPTDDVRKSDRRRKRSPILEVVDEAWYDHAIGQFA